MLDLKGKRFKFPNISRIITETPHDQQLFYVKIFSVSFVSTFLIVAIMLKGVTLFTNIGELQAAEQQRTTLKEQQHYWEKIVKEHPDYRDAYFQLAVTSYQLGEKKVAKEYLDKTLMLDPHFEQGKELERQLGK